MVLFQIYSWIGVKLGADDSCQMGFVLYTCMTLSTELNSPPFPTSGSSVLILLYAIRTVVFFAPNYIKLVIV